MKRAILYSSQNSKNELRNDTKVVQASTKNNDKMQTSISASGCDIVKQKRRELEPINLSMLRCRIQLSYLELLIHLKGD